MAHKTHEMYCECNITGHIQQLSNSALEMNENNMKLQSHELGYRIKVTAKLRSLSQHFFLW